MAYRPTGTPLKAKAPSDPVVARHWNSPELARARVCQQDLAGGGGLPVNGQDAHDVRPSAQVQLNRLALDGPDCPLNHAQVGLWVPPPHEAEGLGQALDVVATLLVSHGRRQQVGIFLAGTVRRAPFVEGQSDVGLGMTLGVEHGPFHGSALVQGDDDVMGDLAFQNRDSFQGGGAELGVRDPQIMQAGRHVLERELAIATLDAGLLADEQAIGQGPAAGISGQRNNQRLL